MPRIAPVERDQMFGQSLERFDRELSRFGRLTNMKRTLLRSPPAYHALMEWYPLFDTIRAFLGERLAIIFAHAISSESDCLICTTFMRRLLISSGDNPNDLNLDEQGKVLVEFGRRVVQPGSRVPDELYHKLARFFNDEQIVALTAFAGLMAATNMINNILEVDLDEYLYEFRDKKSPGKQKTANGAGV